jgi:hypothetical protein
MKHNFGGVLGKSERSFPLETGHIVRLASKIGEEVVSKKISNRKSVFRLNDFGGILGKSEQSFHFETSHIIRLSPKIGEGVIL